MILDIAIRRWEPIISTIHITRTRQEDAIAIRTSDDKPIDAVPCSPRPRALVTQFDKLVVVGHQPSIAHISISGIIARASNVVTKTLAAARIVAAGIAVLGFCLTPCVILAIALGLGGADVHIGPQRTGR